MPSLFSKASLVVVLLASLSGCAATALHPGARSVLVTRQPAPAGCRYIGTVIGEQGGSFTGAYTSNKRLMEGAMNDMKNKAHEMGGNYVVLEESKAGSTLSKGSGGQTDVTNIGNAYYCPSGETTVTTSAPVQAQ